MSLASAATAPSPLRRSLSLAAWITGGAFLIFSLLLILEQGRVALAAAFLFVFIAMARVNIQAAVLAVMVYVTFVGDLRRMLIPFFTWTGRDPLLLVGGVFAILVVAGALAARQVKFDTPLAKMMAALTGIMVLQIFNPGQGGLVVGVAGIMFVIVPILWFWVGRTYATERMVHLLFYRVIVPLALVGAALGVYQFFYGYLPYQKLWLADNWYAGLGSPDKPAAISLFASNTEYGNYTVIGAALLWAAFVSKQRTAILLVPVLIATMLVTGSRGPVAKLFLAIAVIWAVQGRDVRTWTIRGGLALVVGLMGLGYSITTAASMTGDEDIQKNLARQAEEFTAQGRAEDDGYSSSGNHLSMMLGAYTWTLSNPLGMGLGATSQAAGKFGGNSHTSETDLGDSFISTGIVGGALYHVIVAVILMCLVRYWLLTRRPVALALIGVLCVTFLQWQGGGQYAVSTIVWFCIGALDRLYTDARRASALDTASVVPVKRFRVRRPAEPALA